MTFQAALRSFIIVTVFFAFGCSDERNSIDGMPTDCPTCVADGGPAGDPDADSDDGDAAVGCTDCVSGTGFISYVGCSQTRDNTDGYETLGGTRLESWASGGCSIDRWLDPGNECWTDYEKSVQGRTPEAGYFQICIRSSDPVVYADVVEVIGMYQAKLPTGAQIYVNGLEIFEPDDECHLASGDIQAQTRAFADQLVTDGYALRVPDLGPLTPENTMEDGCHPGEDGRLLTGGQLIDFFGSGE